MNMMPWMENCPVGKCCFFFFFDVSVSADTLSSFWMVGVQELYDFLWTETIPIALIFPLSSSWVIKKSLRPSFQNDASENGRGLKANTSLTINSV